MTMHIKETPAQIEDHAIQFHREVVEIVRCATGMHEPIATPMATAIVQEMRKRWGGSRLGRRDVYIHAPNNAARNAAICAEFNGANMVEICKKHDVSRSHVYRITKSKPQ